MAAILALDYGTKRCGLATTDPLQMIASPLDVVETLRLLDYLVNHCATEKIESIVIGEPKHLCGEAADLEKEISAFIGRLLQALPGIKIERFDERFTSKMAFQTMIDAGLSRSKRREKGLIDRTSAVIILQGYMETRK